MDLKLANKVALITGGSRGIGLRTARLFAEEGVHLGICGRRSADVEAAAAELRAAGVKVAAMPADVTVPAEAAAFVEHCAAELGQIDILINNVGGSAGGVNLMEVSNEDWQRTFELNPFQMVRMARLVVPHLRRQGGGAIVNLASISGWHPQLSGSPQYGTAKAAVIFMTERLALELSRDNIRVNTVSPGSIVWDGGDWGDYRKTQPDAYATYVREGFPMGRLGAPEEVADVIVFMASPRANWINGRHISVDGLEQPVPAPGYRPW
jgi:3-oxoacyl-[acyl-carrier protein] reductase